VRDPSQTRTSYMAIVAIWYFSITLLTPISPSTFVGGIRESGCVRSGSPNAFAYRTEVQRRSDETVDKRDCVLDSADPDDCGRTQALAQTQPTAPPAPTQTQQQPQTQQQQYQHPKALGVRQAVCPAPSATRASHDPVSFVRGSNGSTLKIGVV
jgi:hypothetical protein